MAQAGTGDELTVSDGTRTWRCTVGRTWTIGRDPASDIVLESDKVSRQHATLEWVEAAWVIRDEGSRNGTWVGGRKVAAATVGAGLTVAIGGSDGPVLSIARVTAAARAVPADGTRVAAPGRDAPVERSDWTGADPSSLGEPIGLWRIGTTGLRIGRSPDNDVVIADPLVSRHHALIGRDSSGRLVISDLESSNGTFVNGRRITRIVIGDRDLLTIGGRIYAVKGDVLHEYEEATGAWLCALGLEVVINGSRLLTAIDFALEPSSLLGLVGPSGAGKTTLLKALSGQQPATSGHVMYGGRDLYAAHDLRRRMGYVPQDDLLHTQLTVGQALSYAAELRFARDVDADTREARVEEVMRELGLIQRRDLPIANLSGGQRKRTSVAVELLARPPLLYLDEPTSGLDPGNEEQVTSLMRELADGGRTVVVATHSLVTLDRCDRVLFLARGGRIAFYGPPKEADRYFREQGRGNNYPEVFANLDATDGAPAGEAFARHPLRQTYIAKPLAEARSATPPEDTKERAERPDRFRQWAILVRRYLAVIRADRASSLVLLLQAPFFAVLFLMLYGRNVMTTSKSNEAMVLLWLLVVGATWMGTSNSLREIVKERAILVREHRLGLSLVSYVLSKVGVLSVITVVQCAILVLIAMIPHELPPTVVKTVAPAAVASPAPPAGSPPPSAMTDGTAITDGTAVAVPPGASPGAPPPMVLPEPTSTTEVLPVEGVFLPSRLPELVIAVVAAGLAAMSAGLLLSVLVRNADQANFVLPLILVAQVILSAPFGATGEVFKTIGKSASARWGTAAAASTVDLASVRRPLVEAIENFLAKLPPDPDAPEGDKQKHPNEKTIEGEPDWRSDRETYARDLGALGAILLAGLVGVYLALARQLRSRSRT